MDKSVKSRYQGARNFSAVMREYAAKRKTSYEAIAVRINRSYSSISHLMRGRQYGSDHEDIFPYFGDKDTKGGGGEASLRELVVRDLNIPRRKWEPAYLDDKLEWAVEQLRRERARPVKVSRKTKTLNGYSEPIVVDLLERRRVVQSDYPKLAKAVR